MFAPITALAQLNLLTFNKGLSVYTFNLPAGPVGHGGTCLGSSPWCRKHCYARKGNFTFKSVKASHRNHHESSRYTEAFIQRMVAEVQFVATKGHYNIRIHSSGDFYSLDYLNAWVQIARLCPETRFYAYSRTWRGYKETRVGSKFLTLAEIGSYECPKNLTLWCSVDPSIHRRPPVACRISFVDGSEGQCKPNCAKQLNKGRANCLTCGLCFNPNARKVCFLKH